MSDGATPHGSRDVLSVINRSSEAAQLLRGLEPGYQTLELFTELARLATMSTVELVPLKFSSSTERTEVLLLQRPATDPWWPNQWHVPGTVISPTDPIPQDEDIDFDDPDFNPVDSYGSSVARLIDKEFEGKIKVIHGPRFLEARYRAGKRGHDSTIMLWGGIENTDDLPSSSQLFDVESVASRQTGIDLIVGHAGLVERAAQAYKAFRATSV